MSKKEKGLLSLLLVGVIGAVVGLGVFGAFSATTSNTGNEFTAGTVAISDNDSNTAMYSVSNQKPGDTLTRCIRVTYTGSLASNVRLYTTSSIGALGPHVNLTVTPGTMPTGTTLPATAPGSSADGAAIFNGTLSNFAGDALELRDGAGRLPGLELRAGHRATTSSTSSRCSCRRAPDTVQGATTGTHAYTWEAQNQ